MLARNRKGSPRVPMQTIWIDLENSPHVVFFRPIISALEKRGHHVILSARDAYNVFDLLERFDLQSHRIGRHYGKNVIMKGIGMLIRAAQLNGFVRQNRPALAVSHGSRAQLVICNLLNVPSLLIGDYEYTGELGIPFIKPTVYMCPEVISASECGKGVANWRKYPGIKENISLLGFTPNPSIYQEIGLDQNDLVATVRPPATSAYYHVKASDYAFSAAMEVLLEHPSVKIVLLPRTSDQAEACRCDWKEGFQSNKIVIPHRAIDGLNLSWHSDLVVSGGGTMNREAATLGVPVYSIFQGRIGAVDQWLSDNGKIKLIRSVDDVRSTIKIERRQKNGRPPQCDVEALSTILDQVERMVGSEALLR